MPRLARRLEGSFLYNSGGGIQKLYLKPAPIPWTSPRLLAADLFDRLRRRMDRAFELGMRGLCLGRDRDIGAVASGAQRDREPDAA